MNGNNLKDSKTTNPYYFTNGIGFTYDLFCHSHLRGRVLIPPFKGTQKITLKMCLIIV